MNFKNLIAVFVFAALATTISAQSNYQIGITAGANQSSLKSDLFNTSSGRLNAAIGCTFVVGINDFFELNQEIAFVQKGAKAQAVYFRPEAQPEQLTYDYYYNTFEAGLFAGIKPFRSVPVTFQAGGFLGTHFHNMDRSQTEVYVGDYHSLNNATQAVDLNDAFAGVDMGPAFGISAGTGQVRVNARYYLGTRNLYNNLDFVEEGHTITTNSFRLSISYFLK
ncbi:MAG: outer membrane beta-barrel protein [Saprospiraceae bacterium]|jgi:hypothetical protein